MFRDAWRATAAACVRISCRTNPCLARGRSNSSAAAVPCRLRYVPTVRFDAGLIARLAPVGDAPGWLPRPDAVYMGAGLWATWPTPFIKTPWRWVGWSHYNLFAEHLDAALDAAAQLHGASGTTPPRAANGVRGGMPTGAKGGSRVSGAAGSRSSGGGPHVLVSTIPSVCNLTVGQRDIFSCGLWLMRSFGLSFERAQSDCARGVRARASSLELNAQLRATLAARPAAARQHKPSGHSKATFAAAIAAASTAGASARRARAVSLVDMFGLTDGRCWANLDGEAMHLCVPTRIE